MMIYENTNFELSSQITDEIKIWKFDSSNVLYTSRRRYVCIFWN